MSDIAPQTVVICTGAGDWSEPGATDADMMHLLQDAGYLAQIVRTAPDVLAALDVAVLPAVVILDWRMLGVYTEDDLKRAERYNRLWELVQALDQRRGKSVRGTLIILCRQVPTGGGFGLPQAVRGDMYLRYPFHPQELLSFVARFFAHQPPPSRPFSDDRLSDSCLPQ